MNHRKVYICLTIFIVLMLAGCGGENQVYLESSSEDAWASEQVTIEEMETETDTEESDGLCYVYVCGAVEQPGVYLLQVGSRVYEAIALAGGLTEDAAGNVLNQAEPVSDGQMIQVLTKEEAAGLSAEEEQKEITVSQADDGKININTATAEVLMTLPGVGQSKAESIIAYREERGTFSSIEAIKNVNGIKDGVYNQIKDKITVD